MYNSVIFSQKFITANKNIISIKNTNYKQSFKQSTITVTERRKFRKVEGKTRLKKKINTKTISAKINGKFENLKRFYKFKIVM